MNMSEGAEPVTKEIRLPAPHPRFRPRVAEGMRRPGHPGTAVRIGADLYEVVAAGKEGRTWIYRLEPWPDRETIRAFVDWPAGAEREFAAGLNEERARERRAGLARGAQVLLGFLPADRQERLSRTTGVDPARATFRSAAAEAVIALPFAFGFVVRQFIPDAAQLGLTVPGWAGVTAIVALADGVFRLVAVIVTGDPIGSLFLVFLNFRSRPRDPRHVPGDEIAETVGGLLVISPVRKAWWEREGGVTYAGEAYSLEDQRRDRTTYQYRFRKGGEGFPVLDPEQEKARNRASDLSYVFAVLWGFLPAERQADLEFFGRYKARPYVIISIFINILIAIALVGPGLRAAAQGKLGLGGLITLALSIVLFAESAVRLLRLLTEGRPSGSLVGLLVKPLHDLAFAARPDRPAGEK